MASDTTTAAIAPEDLLARAGEVHAALLAAREEVTGMRPETVVVDGVELPALSLDDTDRHAADRARAGFPGGSPETPRRGGGETWWRNHVGIMKFGCAAPLAAAFRATGEEEYAQALRDYLEDFFAFYEDGASWDKSNLRTAVRVTKWLNTLPYLLDSDAFDGEFVGRVVASARLQLNWLLERLRREQKPGNIRLFQANALLWASLLLPELPEAEAWLGMARRIYNDTARREIEPDGSHIEHEPNYHGLYRGTFYNLALWSRAFPEAQLPAPVETALRVWDYALAATKPSGQSSGLQEGHSPWVGGAGTEGLREQYHTLQRLAGQEPAPPPLWKHSAQAGHVFLRDGWDREATYLIFDATRWGGAHSHPGRNGLILHAHGRTLLTPAGSLSYAMQQKAHEGDELDARMGFYGKSTRSKNTCTFNDWNQAPTNPDVLKSLHAPGCHAVFSGYSGGYWPGPYGWYWGDGFGAGLRAFHQRLLIWVPGGAALVLDHLNRWDEEALGRSEQAAPSLQQHWQFTPGRVELDAENRRAVTRHEDANLLMLFPQVARGTAFSLHEGELDPPRGWISTRRGREVLAAEGVFDHPPLADWKERSYAPAPLLRLQAAPMEEYIAELVTVLLPFAGAEEPELSVELGGAIREDGVRTGPAWARLRYADGSTDELVWTPELQAPLFEHGALATDASLLHLHRDAGGALQSGTALDGSWCEGDGAEQITVVGNLEGERV